MRAKRIVRSRGGRLVGALTALALLPALMGTTQADAADAARRPRVPKVKPVPVANVRDARLPGPSKAERAGRANARALAKKPVDWPAPGELLVTQQLQKLGKFAFKTDGNSPYRVELLPRSESKRLGIEGPLLRISPAPVTGPRDPDDQQPEEPTSATTPAPTPSPAPSPAVEPEGEAAPSASQPTPFDEPARGETQESKPTKLEAKLNLSSFAHAFGADWFGRLRVLEFPACSLSTPREGDCLQATELKSEKNAETLSVSVSMPLAGRASSERSIATSGTRVMALSASGTSASGTGSFAATPLSPAGSWSHGGSSGNFTWSHPMRMPPSNGGPAPQLDLTYSAQSVDGRTAATNNQASWAGEGWDIASSYVERGYVTCRDDAVAGKFDQCWKTDNATLVMNGTANELIKAADGTWRLSKDDGSRVRHLTAAPGVNADNDKEYWEVTAPDGTRYYFGRSAVPNQTGTTNSVWTVPVAGNNAGEPCHGATFATSFCTQAWRWNLDYVVDPRGNGMSFWYTAETNYYAKNGVASPGTIYTRGGYLNRIDYGLREGSTYTNPPMRVTFTSALRCFTATCGTVNAANYPDTPTDQICNAGTACTGKLAPTFFTKYRLSYLTSNVLKAGAFQPVDRWTLREQFLNDGIVSNSSLWLAGVQHQGMVGGTAALPETTFTPVQLVNRVDSSSDGISSLPRYRVGTVTSETGAVTNVTYSGAQCTTTNKPAAADTNSLRCFPQKWTPEGNTSPRTDWFHKYVMNSVTVTDPTGDGQPMTTTYGYQGTPAWAYEDNKLIPDSYRTWSSWRGYEKVVTTQGPSSGTRSESRTTYFRGMDGDKLTSGTRTATVTDSLGQALTDSRQLAGMARETITYADAGAAAVQKEIRSPWSVRTAGSGAKSAWFVDVAESDTHELVSGGSWRQRKVSTTFDATTGRPTRVSDSGQVGLAGDEACTATEYADATTPTGTWRIGFASRVVSSKGACSTDALTPSAAQVLADVRTRYDSLAQGQVPTKGLITQTDRISGHDSTGAPQYQVTTTTAYDAWGRPTSVTVPVEGGSRQDTTAYTMSTDNTLVKVTATKDAGGLAFVTATDVNPFWGAPTKQSDPNAHVTSAAYDSLGRVTSVWLPHMPATGPASSKYAYLVSKTGASAVTTSKIRADGTTYTSSVDLFDSLLRPRQTQRPSPDGGRIITASAYDGRGLVFNQAEDVYATGAPSTTRVSFSDGVVPAMTVRTFDGLGRPTREELKTNNTLRWATTLSYAGMERSTIDPPSGAPSVTSVTDIRGQLTQKTEHGTPDLTTDYTWDLRGNLVGMTGPAGTFTYDYDVRNRKVSASDPDTGQTAYGYTANDVLKATTDARGKTATTSFDKVDRPVELHAGPNTTDPATLLTKWTYDTVAKGQLSSSTRYVGGATGDQLVSRVLAYDLLDTPYRRSFQVIPAAGSDLLTGLPTNQMTWADSYNLDATLRGSTMPAVALSATNIVLSSEGIDYARDTDGRLKSMLGRAGIVLDSLYDSLGRPVQYTLGRGDTTKMWVQREYDDGTNRLDRTFTLSSITNEMLTDHTYSYDAAGNPQRDTDAVTGDTQCFSYDSHRRLANAWSPADGSCSTPAGSAVLGGPAPYRQSWTFNDRGLRKTQQTVTGTGSSATTVTDDYTYPAAGAVHANFAKAITRTRTGSSGNDSTTLLYDYDATGNTVTRPTQNDAVTGDVGGNGAPGSRQSLTWNNVGDLDTLVDESATEGEATTRYIYGVDGALLLRDDAKAKNLYLGDTQVTLAKATNKVSAQRFYATDLGLTAVRSSDTEITYLLPQQQDSDEAAVDGLTHSVTRRYLTPYGENRTDAPSGTTSWPSDRAFLGKSLDQGTGLTSVGAREYDAAIGRFISPDPILDPVDPAQALAYPYANNNPLAFSDPTGLRPLDADDGESFGTGSNAEASSHTTNSESRPPSAQSSNSRSEHTQSGGCGRNPTCWAWTGVRKSMFPDSFQSAMRQAKKFGRAMTYGGVKDECHRISWACAAEIAMVLPLPTKWLMFGKVVDDAADMGHAANSGSRLAEASAAAFRAADNPSSIFIKNKHLASSGIRGGKFASDDIAEVQGWVAQGLRSDGVQFLPNQLDDTFRAIVPAGRVVGTGGQTNIRVIVTYDGRVINAFPVNVR